MFHTLRRRLTRTLDSPLLSRRLASSSTNQTTTLAYELQGDSSGDKNNLFILHGLLGQGRNWRTFSRRLRGALGEDDWRVFLVDLRGHGKSSSVRGGPNTVTSAAHDVHKLAESLGAHPDVVVGHSLGGKVALEYSKLALKTPRQVWSLDSVPGRVSGDAHGVDEVLKAIVNLPRRIPSRRWLAEALPQFSTGLVDWIGSNLKNVDDGKGDELEFVFDIDVAHDLYTSYRETDSWDAFENTQTEAASMYVVKAANSTRWSNESIDRLKSSSRSKFMELANAGHWVHTDNPDGLLEMLVSEIFPNFPSR